MVLDTLQANRALWGDLAGMGTTLERGGDHNQQPLGSTLHSGCRCRLRCGQPWCWCRCARWCVRGVPLLLLAPLLRLRLLLRRLQLAQQRVNLGVLEPHQLLQLADLGFQDLWHEGGQVCLVRLRLAARAGEHSGV